jgi:hypothetical protein
MGRNTAQHLRNRRRRQKLKKQLKRQGRAPAKKPG